MVSLDNWQGGRRVFSQHYLCGLLQTGTDVSSIKHFRYHVIASENPNSMGDVDLLILT